MKSLFAVAMLCCAQMVTAEETRIYQTNSLGNKQYHKPSFAIQEDGRVIQVDPYGNKQYHKQQYQLEGGELHPIDTIGNKQYQKRNFGNQ